MTNINPATAFVQNQPQSVNFDITIIINTIETAFSQKNTQMKRDKYCDKLIVVFPQHIFAPLSLDICNKIESQLQNHYCKSDWDTVDLITAANKQLPWGQSFATRDASPSYGFNNSVDPFTYTTNVGHTFHCVIFTKYKNIVTSPESN